MSITDSHEPEPGSSPRFTDRAAQERELEGSAEAPTTGGVHPRVAPRAAEEARSTNGPPPKAARARASRAGDVALEDEVWMGRAQALVRLVVDPVDTVEGAVLVRDHRFLGETASRERPERGVLRGRAGRDATLYLTRTPREPARLAAIRDAGVRRLVVCEATPTSIAREAERLGLELDVLEGAGVRCA